MFIKFNLHKNIHTINLLIVQNHELDENICDSAYLDFVFKYAEVNKDIIL